MPSPSVSMLHKLSSALIALHHSPSRIVAPLLIFTDIFFWLSTTSNIFDVMSLPILTFTVTSFRDYSQEYLSVTPPLPEFGLAPLSLPSSSTSFFSSFSSFFSSFYSFLAFSASSIYLAYSSVTSSTLLSDSLCNTVASLLAFSSFFLRSISSYRTLSSAKIFAFLSKAPFTI